MNLTLFDLDGTLIPVDSDHSFGAFMVEVGWADRAHWGARNDEFFAQYNAGTLDLPAYIEFATSAWRVRPHDLVFLRAELVDKDILEAGGYDPPGFVHPHPLSRVGALTLGYEHRLGAWTHYTLGLGGDVTAHRTPPNLLENYGHPVSLHVRLILKSTY